MLDFDLLTDLFGAFLTSRDIPADTSQQAVDQTRAGGGFVELKSVGRLVGRGRERLKRFGFLLRNGCRLARFLQLCEQRVHLRFLRGELL